MQPQVPVGAHEHNRVDGEEPGWQALDDPVFSAVHCRHGGLVAEAGDQGLQPEGHETHAGKTGVGRQTSPRNRATHEWGHGMDDVGAPECEVHTAEGAEGTGGGAGVRDGALVGTKNDSSKRHRHVCGCSRLREHVPGRFVVSGGRSASMGVPQDSAEPAGGRAAGSGASGQDGGVQETAAGASGGGQPRGHMGGAQEEDKDSPPRSGHDGKEDTANATLVKDRA